MNAWNKWMLITSQDSSHPLVEDIKSELQRHVFQPILNSCTPKELFSTVVFLITFSLPSPNEISILQIYYIHVYALWLLGGPHTTVVSMIFSHTVPSSQNQFSSAWRPITCAENECSKVLAMLYFLTWRVGTQVFKKYSCFIHPSVTYTSQ